MEQKTRATRRKQEKREKRGAGLSFFLVSLGILVFSLVYVFWGDALFTAFNASDAIFPRENEIVVTFLDVGQGDSILIRSAEHAVLIDGGEHRYREVITDYLRDARVNRLDFVVATHPHSDHIGGLVTVLRDFEVGYVIMPDVTNYTETFKFFLSAIENNDIPVHFPVAGDRLQAGIISLLVISPPSDLPWTINNMSIVLRMEHGETSFLFTGDAEAEAERWIIANNENLQSTVLKVGHHGSRTSTTEAFLYAVSPTIAVIQVAANSRFGHPHHEVIDRLDAFGVATFRTSELGTIRMITNGTRIYLL
ncbi:MAG: MBL fold metallo-hydrolase [Defluviitaleaceae bacterium]|nr:MBL fold metallo-hydrolase [Defluviitaleaceae bacterium]